jgi:hypothetical protein
MLRKILDYVKIGAFCLLAVGGCVGASWFCCFYNPNALTQEEEAQSKVIAEELRTAERGDLLFIRNEKDYSINEPLIVTVRWHKRDADDRSWDEFFVAGLSGWRSKILLGNLSKMVTQVVKTDDPMWPHYRDWMIFGHQPSTQPATKRGR